MVVRLQVSHLLIHYSLLLSLSLSNSSTNPARRNYRGSKIIEARPHSQSQTWFVNELSYNGHLHVLNPTQNPTGATRQPSSIIAEVSSRKWSTTEKLLNHRNVAFDVIVDDYQKYIEENQASSKRTSQFDVDYFQDTETGYSDQYNIFDKKSVPTFDFNKYNKLSDINALLDTLQAIPSKHVQVKEYGRSTEGRPLRAVHVGNDPEYPMVATIGHDKQGKHVRPKPIVVVDATIHAREWITTSSILCLLQHLIEQYEGDIFLSQFHWIILPVLNPDGYEHSWRVDRLWRKTRSNSSFTSRFVRGRDVSVDCAGADPNRNWGFHWGERGVQRYNTCSEVYAGPYPFSEPEVAALSDLVEYYRQRTILYVSLHAFSQVILSPYGYSRGRPRDYAQHLTIMKAGADAIKAATGYIYKFGPIYEAMYAASGSAIDYLYGSMGIKQAFVIELRDTGRFGFVLPKEEILPTCKETIAAVLAMSKTAHAVSRHRTQPIS